MKSLIIILICIFVNISCKESMDNEKIKTEIRETEKAFEIMASQKGIAEAFYYFADENAVIKRENDTLIIGKENIKKYYKNKKSQNIELNWTPSFIEVSSCGTMAYTYGRYILKKTNQMGDTMKFKGIFHTIWKKQKGNNWKYVWD